MFTKKPRVFIDTNFLLIPGRFKVDIFSQIQSLAPSAELVILEDQLKELEHIVKGDNKVIDKNAAKLAILILKQKSLKMIRGFEGSVDDQIVREASGQDMVATQDKALKTRLTEKGISVLVLKQKKIVAYG